MKVSKRIKKQFLKQLNKEIQLKYYPGQNEIFFKEWNEDVSVAWIKKIESSQKQLDRIKKIKFSHENEEKDFNQYNQEKYTQILREEQDLESNDSDSVKLNEEQQLINSEPFFKKKPRAKIVLRQSSINEFLVQQSSEQVIAELGFMNQQDQRRINRDHGRNSFFTAQRRDD